jgi:hypothetical protein
MGRMSGRKDAPSKHGIASCAEAVGRIESFGSVEAGVALFWSGFFGELTVN